MVLGLLSFATMSAEDRRFFGPAVVVGVVGITGIGAALGALIGFGVRTERWETVPLDELQVGVIWSGNAPKIALQMNF